MSFLDLAKNRYTTKKYDPQGEIDDEAIDALQQILRLCPSSINSQPWLFTFVSDPQVKSELAKVSYHNEHKINDSCRLVVFSVRNSVNDFEKYNLALLPPHAANYYHERIKPLGEAAILSWMAHQVYISLGFFLSACASMGIDSTPMEGIRTDEYDRILRQEGYKTLFAAVIGRRAKDDANQPSITPKFRFPADNVIRTI